MDCVTFECDIVLPKIRALHFYFIVFVEVLEIFMTVW